MGINDVIAASALVAAFCLAFVCYRAYASSRDAAMRLDEVDDKLGRLRELVGQIESAKQEVRASTGKKVDHVALERIFSDAIGYFMAELEQKRGFENA